MNGSHANVLLGGLVGFVLGGIVADAFTRVAQVLIATGTIGGFLGGAIGAMLRKDVTPAAAAGSGFGVLVGMIVALLDAFVGG